MNLKKEIVKKEDYQEKQKEEEEDPTEVENHAKEEAACHQRE